MQYDRKKFILGTINTILMMAAIAGICFAFGWSTAFLYCGLWTAAVCVQLPLMLIIRHFFRRERAIILETALILAFSVIVAQQLFVAECIKLFAFSVIWATIQATALIAGIFNKGARKWLINNQYKPFELSEEPAPTSLFDTNSVRDLPHPPTVADESFSYGAASAANEQPIPPDIEESPLDFTTRRTATRNW